MQTFLPYPDFLRSCEVLDSPRLGKQRVETLQILRALELPAYGWANHPAVRMWRGRTPALVCYGLAAVAAWRRRGHADSTDAQIAEFAPGTTAADQAALDAAGQLPGWLGDDRLHRSHRSALVRKDPGFYRPLFGDVPDDLPYHWPDPDPVEGTGPDGETGSAGHAGAGSTRLWVFRAASPTVLGTWVAGGIVGLGPESGLDVDVSGLHAPDLRPLLAEVDPGRRTNRDLRFLATLLDDVAVGDLVGAPVEGDRALLVGEVTGPYAFAPASVGGPLHRRAVRWDRRFPRSAVRPPAALQDPRRLFDVRVDAG